MKITNKIAVAGLSVMASLAAPVCATSHLSSSESAPSFVHNMFVLMSLGGQKKLDIKNDVATQIGFEPNSFTIHLPQDASKVPAYCGYDEKNREIVPIKLSYDHMLFDGLVEALNHVTKRPNDGIFEHLYGQNKADIFKLLWENPYGRPESKLSGLTGLFYEQKSGSLQKDELCTMIFDLQEAIKNKKLQTFIPRVYSVTYDRFLQVQKQYPNIDFLEGIEKLLTYKATAI